MKLPSLLLSLIVLASGSTAGLAEEKPVLQTAEPFIEPKVLQAAEIAVNRDVMNALQTPFSHAIASAMSRTRIPAASQLYTLSFTSQAPNGVTKTPAHLPFEVKQQLDPKEAGTLFLSGYYDAITQTTQLYSSATKAYVPAAEHPFVKSRLPKK